LSFTPFVLSIFKNKIYILHHFAFLVWLPPHNFLCPITRFLPLKTHFLTTISPLSALFFMVHKGYIYTIVMYFHTFYLAFSGILPCVLHQNALHLAPFYLAFSTKTHRI